MVGLVRGSGGWSDLGAWITWSTPQAVDRSHRESGKWRCQPVAAASGGRSTQLAGCGRGSWKTASTGLPLSPLSTRPVWPPAPCACLRPRAQLRRSLRLCVPSRIGRVPTHALLGFFCFHIVFFLFTRSYFLSSFFFISATDSLCLLVFFFIFSSFIGS